MKLLLDTHVWLWAVQNPSQLGREAARLLADTDNSLWLSPISAWEAHLLVEKGRLVEGARDSAAWVRWALKEMPLRDAPLSREVAIMSRAITTRTADPADRFIAASAAVHELALLTADRKLLKLRGCETIDARR
ncbi:MAG: type II toxin-antitoxin system VapC family toxin [Solirubrobacterales bacterium]